MGLTQPERSLEDVLVTSSYPDDPQLSPDGRLVAYAVTGYGQDGDHPDGSIWLASTDGSTSARRLTYCEGRDEHPRWSPDGRNLAFLSDRHERGTNALYILALDGGEARPLVQRKSSIDTFEWSPDGRYIAFTSPDEPTEDDEKRKEERNDANVYGERWKFARLHLLDVEHGDARAMSVGDRHVHGITWSPDSSQIAFLASPTPEIETRRLSEIFRVSIPDDEIDHVAKVAGWVADALQWSSDGRHLLFVSSHESILSGLAVFAVDLASGGEPRLVAPSPDEDACGMAATTPLGSDRAVIAILQGLTTRLEWLDVESGKRELLYQPSDGDILDIYSVAERAGQEPVVAVIHSTGSQPPELHAGTAGSLRRISDHHAQLSDFEFGTQEPYYWTASDGLELDGILIRPPDAGDDPMPTIVHVHGGPYGRYTSGWNLRPGHWAQWLAYNGFAVLMPNYRGGEGRGNEFAKWAHGGVGDKEFDDIMTATDAAVERGIADPDRLGIGGWSQGGFLTAWAVTQTSRFKAGVMGAGVSDWGMMVMSSDIPTVESMLGGSRPWDGPGPHRSQQHSPVSFARNVETPLLILHGEEDARVPVSQAIGFHRALMETGVETHLVTYPREPHGLRERNHQLDMLRRVRDWFQRRV